MYIHIVSFKWSLINRDIIWESECLSEGNVVYRTINPGTKCRGNKHEDLQMISPSTHLNNRNLPET